MREEKIEYEMMLAKMAAESQWIIADAIKKLEEIGFEESLVAYGLFLHGVIPSLTSMDPYDQANLLDIMDRFNVEQLSDLISEGLDVSKTPFAKSDEERGL